MSAHAILSPSSAHRWIACPGSVVLEVGRPEVEREEQAAGTAKHAIAARCLVDGTQAALYLGTVHTVGEFEIEVDEAVAEEVQAYVDRVRQYLAEAGEGAVLLVEQRVPVSHVTGEVGAEGTADAIIVAPALGEIQAHDAKFGRVRVSAERNPQTSLYLLGAVALYEFTHGPFERVRSVIHQPPLGAVDEWGCTLDELLYTGRNVTEAAGRVAAGRVAAAQAVADPDELADFLSPTEVGCNYCKAKAVCPALAAKVEELVGQDFETIGKHDKLGVFEHNLAACRKAVPLIEGWCKAVREEVDNELRAGRPVEGFKLVQGRQGNRAWADPAQAEAMLVKTFRLAKDTAYTRKVISPTAAEELAQRLDKNTGKVKDSDAARPLKPGQWDKLQGLIVRKPASLVAVPASDKRAAVDVTPVAELFEDATPPQPVEDLLA